MNELEKLKKQFDVAVHEKVQEAKGKSVSYHEAQKILREEYYMVRGKLESMVLSEARNSLVKEAESQLIKK